MQLTENFSLAEFESKDGAEFTEEVIGNLIELSKNLQTLRNWLNDALPFPVAIKINSGYRSPEHNKAVGGVPNSKHTLGQAADIVAVNLDTKTELSPSFIANYLELLIDIGYIKEGGLGRYKTFTHYDIRGTKARWNG